MAAPFDTAHRWHILHAVARRHYWKGEGWLSIKSFRGGPAHYCVGGGHCRIDDSCYLVLNEGRNYSIEIDLPSPIESFCVFFSPEFARDALRCRTRSHTQLLEEDREHRPVEFFEKTYPHNAVVSPLLARLQKAHRDCEQGANEEQMYHLVGALLHSHRQAEQEVEQLPYVRLATRHELYRRAARARDFAQAMFARQISLGDIANAAALSPNHLLRVFAQVYGQTPHQFLTSRRLAEAERLLSGSEMPVTQICFEVGFESLGSFSSLFKRRFGLSPTHYRGRKR